MIARPAATAPDETTTTSRPARCAATTNAAIAPAYSVDSPPPLQASRLLPTLSTARRHGGSICSEKACVAIGSAAVPLVDDDVRGPVHGKRVAGDDGPGLVQAGRATQQIGAAAAVAEAAAELQQPLRAQFVEEGAVRRDQGLVEARATHQQHQVADGRRAHSASQRARSASRRRSAAAPGETRAARLPSGVRPCPALSAAAAAAR